MENENQWPHHWFYVSCNCTLLYQKLMTWAKSCLPVWLLLQEQIPTVLNWSEHWCQPVWWELSYLTCITKLRLLNLLNLSNNQKITILRRYLFEAFLNVPKGCRPQSQAPSPRIAPSPSHTGWLRWCQTCRNRRSSDWIRSRSTLATRPRAFLSTV